MTGPALALGPGLAFRDFLTACAALGGAGNRVRALRPGTPDSYFESAEPFPVLEALRTTFLPAGPRASSAWPGAASAWPAALEDLLRSPIAGQALALFAEAASFGDIPDEAMETERRSLAGFPENTPDRIERMLEKKRALDRKALKAFALKHGAPALPFTAMNPAQRREYLWMWAQSAFLARRRFARAAEAWARASA